MNHMYNGHVYSGLQQYSTLPNSCLCPPQQLMSVSTTYLHYAAQSLDALHSCDVCQSLTAWKFRHSSKPMCVPQNSPNKKRQTRIAEFAHMQVKDKKHIQDIQCKLFASIANTIMPTVRKHGYPQNLKHITYCTVITRTEPWQQVNKFCEILARGFLDMRADRQRHAYRVTDIVIAIFCTPPGAK